MKDSELTTQEEQIVKAFRDCWDNLKRKPRNWVFTATGFDKSVNCSFSDRVQVVATCVDGVVIVKRNNE
jgi:hypothetical protein